MVGAGTFINPLIKIIVTVAILAAVYFFVVKPVLDTTERAFELTAPAFESLEGIGPQIERSVRSAQRIQEKQGVGSSAQAKEANKLLDCVGDAGAEVSAIERCHRRFDPANP